MVGKVKYLNNKTKGLCMAKLIALILVLGIVFISGCILPGAEKSEDIKALEAVEIRQYEGKLLSSISDFRENSIKGPQYVNEEDYVLKITGLVDKPMEYTYNEVIDNYQKYEKVVTLNCVEGWSVTILWEGMLVRELLEDAGVSGDANTIIFHAYDGYTTSFPIDYIMNQDIIMAYKMNNVTIPPERGFPFQLVAESKWGYKWIKWITEIELSDDADYEGYWERRGYNQEGDLNGSKFR
jgi:DMSO/TMAO reductase YedYZ molybdopterin-dependent catalytic subunit